MNIGNFSKGFFNNDLGLKPNGAKRYLKPTQEIEEIEKKLASGMSSEDLSEDEYRKLSAFEKAETAAFHAEVNREIAEAERIAIKLAKGEKLTEEEEKLIGENYPDLKREAEQAKKEAEELKERIKQAKTPEEKQQIATMAINNVGSMLSKNVIGPAQAKIKLAAIEKAIDESQEDNKFINKDMENRDIKAGSFINRKA